MSSRAQPRDLSNYVIPSAVEGPHFSYVIPKRAKQVRDPRPGGKAQNDKTLNNKHKQIKQAK